MATTAAEDRAEQINDLVLWLETCLNNPQLKVARAEGVPVIVHLGMSLTNVQNLYDELKQAKLDRARLALLIN